MRQRYTVSAAIAGSIILTGFRFFAFKNATTRGAAVVTSRPSEKIRWERSSSKRKLTVGAAAASVSFPPHMLTLFRFFALENHFTRDVIAGFLF